MPRVAFLTGIPGAGKSWIGEELSSRNLATHINGDEVRRRAVIMLCPEADSRSIWSESFWDKLFVNTDVQPAIQHAIDSFVVPNLDHSLPILFDAFLTSHAGFRSACTTALNSAGYLVEAVQLFWIDPPLAKVVEQSNSRIKNGIRPGESPIDEREADRRRRILQNRLIPPNIAIGSEAPEILIEQITTFILPDGSASLSASQ